MSKASVLGSAFFCVAVAIGSFHVSAHAQCAHHQADCGHADRVVVTPDEWQDANKPRRMLARIQSNLERVAAGQPTWPAPDAAKPDALLRIVDAYAAFLEGRFHAMDAQLATIEQSARKCRGRSGTVEVCYWQKRDRHFRASYAKAVDSQSPLVRMYAGLRAVNGALRAPAATDAHFHRMASSSLRGAELRLPCRTVVGRVDEFKAVSGILAALGGPALNCPAGQPVDYARDAEWAQHPARFKPHVKAGSKQPRRAPVSRSAPKPGTREAAIDNMGKHPQKAAPILRHYAHVDNLGKLDYALFLHAFEPQTPERDATIRHLLHTILGQITGRVIFPPERYDGSDASLIGTIRDASMSGVANNDSAFYAIPCGILVKRPRLIGAIDMYFGSNRQNFMPRSGCRWGRGTLPGDFPSTAVRAFEKASTDADGHFIANFRGTYKYGMEAAMSAVDTRMRLAPRHFLGASRSANQDYPYQVWGYTSLDNHVVSRRIRRSYRAARKKLSLYYRDMGLDRQDGMLAAKRALFQSVYGANCGKTVPATSLRRMLLEHAPVKTIREHLNKGRSPANTAKPGYLGRDGRVNRVTGGVSAGTSIWSMLPKLAQPATLSDSQRSQWRYVAPAIARCARYAGLDPLLLVAVGDPKAFPLVLQHAHDVDVRNAIGKTALMEAAKFNRLKMVKMLLSHGASVNATTWKPSMYRPLTHDARTALMYAAANGSLQMIKTLLEAGADPFQADTRERRAIDYLLGFGPTPPNAVMTKKQRAVAARLLF